MAEPLADIDRAEELVAMLKARLPDESRIEDIALERAAETVMFKIRGSKSYVLPVISFLRLYAPAQ